MSVAVSNISIYPIKSGAPISLSNTWVDELGLSFDRRFVLADQQGQFITARTEHKICLIKASLIAKGLKLIAPDMPVLTIDYDKFNQQYQSVTVWKSEIQAQHCLTECDTWFSHYLGKSCHLYYFGEKSQRQVKNKTNQLAFADGYPVLLIGEASLADLNAKSQQTISMQQFRPNIVVTGCEAFDEDSWQQIRIGEVEFEIVKPCTRCTFTTINPNTAEPDKQREPLTTLKEYRQTAEGDIYFGQNLIPLNQGQINLDDPVTVLSKKDKPTFFIKKKPTIPKASPENEPSEEEKNMNILFDSWGKYVQGNNQDTILEQGEDAGLIMPYSCRAGMCGRCKVKLDNGQVKQLSTDALTDEEQKQGYILACSSIPTSDITISKA